MSVIWYDPMYGVMRYTIRPDAMHSYALAMIQHTMCNDKACYGMASHDRDGCVRLPCRARCSILERSSLPPSPPRTRKHSGSPCVPVHVHVCEQLQTEVEAESVCIHLRHADKAMEAPTHARSSLCTAEHACACKHAAVHPQVVRTDIVGHAHARARASSDPHAHLRSCAQDCWAPCGVSPCRAAACAVQYGAI